MNKCVLAKAAESGNREKVKEVIPIMDKYMEKRLKLFDGILNNQPESLNPEDRDYCNCPYCNKYFLLFLKEFINKAVKQD